MKGKITKRAVDALACNSNTEAVLWDQEVKGFGVRARGTTKSYILHYRAGTGRAALLRKLTIGRHGSPWTPEQARTEAKRLLGLVASGVDPGLIRATQRTIPTLAEISDLYIAEGTSHKKPSTLRNDRSRLRLHIKPLLGRKRVDQIFVRAVPKFINSAPSA